jgi:molybdopterin molybdotransferase|tara:strand:- start:258 stop:1529 length:1272 start_codon:yes stop_codon:yes gene_type:complete
MISVEEALNHVLDNVQLLTPIEKPILDSLGLVIAEEITSTISIPPTDNSGMDGYAVRSEDIRGADPNNPCTLKIIGEVAAGAMPDKVLEPMTAIRVMTGATIPMGADTVIKFEDTNDLERINKIKDTENILIYKSPLKGTAIRKAGEDIQPGTTILSIGAKLTPASIGLLASLGKESILVYPRPKVAIISSGNELTEPGTPLGAGHIYDINTYSLSALIESYGGTPMIMGIAEDNAESLSKLINGSREADLIITSAGVSAGYYDLVKDVIKDYGSISVWSVKMRPGKPVVFGVLDGKKTDRWDKTVPLIGLPGNPVSAMVASHILVRPAIQKIMGGTQFKARTIEAILEDPIINEDGRRVYARAILSKNRDGQYRAQLAGSQGSNILSTLANSNGLAICPETVSSLPAGSKVIVELIDQQLNL